MIQILASLIFLTSGAFAQEEPLGLTICKNRGIVRSVRVEKDSNTDQFVTWYTKSGKDKEVGRARWKPSAEKFQRNIKKNLEGAGWTCKNALNFKVVSSSGQ